MGLKGFSINFITDNQAYRGQILHLLFYNHYKFHLLNGTQTIKEVIP